MKSIEKCSIISNKSSFKYVVTPSPDPNSIECYKDLLLKNGITTVIRLCCEKKYDESYLETFGITVVDIPMTDGSVPTKEILSDWIKIITTEINKNGSGIAVHCMSGLGRAPLFACVGLVTFEKIDPLDAIMIVRKSIPYALNKKQIEYITEIKIRKSNRGCNIL